MKVGQNNAISIADLFRGNLQYWIPRYQRRYIWDETNWEVLWKDIEKFLSVGEDDKQHFIGTIVTRLDETESPLQKLEIIDGQQRLTTFLIICCVIRDIAATSPEYDGSGIKSKIEDIIKLPAYDANREKARIEKTNNNNLQDEFSWYRLVPKGHDRNIFGSLIEQKVPDQHSGIGRAYKYYIDVITDYLTKEDSSLENLMDVLSRNFPVIQIEIELKDEPEKIFASINDTGRALDEFDYLWNHLFLRARKKGKHKSDKLYDLYWKKFEEEAFWDSAEKRDLFFRTFLTAKRGPKCFERTKKTIKAFDLYREYSKTLVDDPKYIKACSDEPSLDQVEYEFRQLSYYADSYQDLYDPYLISEDSELRKFGNRMQFDDLILPSLASFILFLVHEVELVNGSLPDVFEILEAYIVRRMLCAKRNEDIYAEINAFFNAIIDSKFKVKDLIDSLYGSWSDSEQVEKALNQASSKDDNLIVQILYEIEQHKGGLKDSQLGFKDMKGPEHIVYPNFLSDFHIADSIGNLTLLTSCPEDGLRTCPFNKEKKMHLQEVGRNLILTKEICAKENWSAAEISERAADLFSHFEQIWKPIEEFMVGDNYSKI